VCSFLEIDGPVINIWDNSTQPC